MHIDQIEIGKADNATIGHVARWCDLLRNRADKILTGDYWGIVCPEQRDSHVLRYRRAVVIRNRDGIDLGDGLALGQGLQHRIIVRKRKAPAHGPGIAGVGRDLADTRGSQGQCKSPDLADVICKAWQMCA